MHNITINSRGGGALYKVTPQPTTHKERRMLSTEDSILRECERWCRA